MSARLQLNFFGPIQVIVDGEPLPRLRSKKALSLLTILVLRNGRPAARGWLAATLWPDVDLSTALSSLRPLVSELRKALGSEAERLKVIDRDTVAFDVDGLSIDVLEFDKAAKSEDLQTAIEKHSGPLFEGCTEEWVFQERQIRLEAFIAAVIRYGSIVSDEADFEKVIPIYRRAIAADPLRDSPRRGLMKAYAAVGNINAALQEYRDFALHLSRELGLVPEPDTTDLYRRLRQEIRRPKLSSAPLHSPISSTVTGNLPSRIDALIGREDEQIDVAALVRENRLVTLTGSGGIGKTELAIAVSTNLRRTFPEGVWFFALEALTQQANLLSELAVLLNPSGDLKGSSRHVINQRLGKGPALLILDNCEHLIESASEFAEELLRSCGKLQVLATSRKVLGLPGETAWPVPPLGYPMTASLPESRATRLRVASDYDGVRLFVQRARAVNSDFALTYENVLSVVDICAQLEGNALGIELAAARARSVFPDRLADSLRMHSLEILKARGGRSSARQNSVRATLDWSFDLLAPTEQAVLRRLSIFLGGWSLSAAEKVAAGGGVEEWIVAEILDSLVDHSLVVHDPKLSRYRLLETVRQYAEEKLSQSAERECLIRNVRHWAHKFVSEHEMRAAGAVYSESVAAIRMEMPNIRIAIDSCSDEPLIGLSIVSKLRRYFGYDGILESGLELFERALQRDHSAIPSPERAEALLGAGILAQQADRPDRAKILLSQALKSFEQLDLLSGQAETLDEMTALESAAGNVALALSYCKKGIEILTRVGDKVQLAKSLSTYSVMLSFGSDPELLRDASMAAVRLQRELGGTAAVVWPLRMVALAEKWVGNWDAAQGLIDEGLRLLSDHDDLNNLALMHDFAGRHAFDMCDLASAEFHYEQAIQTYERANLAHWTVRTMWAVGALRVAQGRVAEAERIVKDLCSTLTSNRGTMSFVEEDLGVLALLRKDYREARNHFWKGLQVAIDSQYIRAIPHHLERLAIVSLADGDTVGAAKFIGAAEKVRSDIKLVRTPYRSKLIDPVIEDCLQILGPELFSAERLAGHELDLSSLV